VHLKYKKTFGNCGFRCDIRCCVTWLVFCVLKECSILWIKPTNALNSNFIGITTLHVSGSLSAYHQEFLAVHRFWYILCSCEEPSEGSILLLVANSSSQLHKMYQSRCTASASVGFIHKESVTTHGHTIGMQSLHLEGLKGLFSMCRWSDRPSQRPES